MPVEGPPRWTFTQTRGSSAMLASPSISVFERHARPRGGGHGLFAGERCAHDGADSGDFILGLQDRPAVFPDLAVEELHDLGGRRDRVAAEKSPARENRRGARTYRCRPSGSFVPGPPPAAVSWRSSFKRIRLGELHPGLKRPLVPFDLRRPFLRNFLRMPASMLFRPIQTIRRSTRAPPCSSPFRCPAFCFAISLIGT